MGRQTHRLHRRPIVPLVRALRHEPSARLFLTLIIIPHLLRFQPDLPVRRGQTQFARYIHLRGPQCESLFRLKSAVRAPAQLAGQELFLVGGQAERRTAAEEFSARVRSMMTVIILLVAVKARRTGLRAEGYITHGLQLQRPRVKIILRFNINYP